MGVVVHGCTCNGRTHSHHYDDDAPGPPVKTPEDREEARLRLHLKRPTAWDKVNDDYMNEGAPKRFWRHVAPLPGVLRSKAEERWEKTKAWWHSRRGQPSAPLTPGAAALIGRFAGSYGVIRVNPDDPYAHELVQHGLAQWSQSPGELRLTDAGYRSAGLLGAEPR